MSPKRKLTHNQTRQSTKQPTTLDDSQLATGVIVSHFGEQLAVQLTDLPPNVPAILGDIWRCRSRAKLPALSCGDKVKLRLDESDLGMIEQLLPRQTLIARPDRYHKVKPVASNVDTLVIVFAPLPKPSCELIDRYLLIARLSGVRPLLVLNKSDLLDEHTQVKQIFEEYQHLGKKYDFDCLLTNHQGLGLDALHEKLQNKFSVFAGQSGVGKSSLINELLPNAQQATNVISDKCQLGQHTTTASRLLAFDEQNLYKGGVIDTPGIREYGVWHLQSDDILVGFDELNELSGQCQFRDCNHTQNAKGCAFWHAVQSGQILPRRMENFHRLVSESKNGKS